MQYVAATDTHTKHPTTTNAIHEDTRLSGLSLLSRRFLEASPFGAASMSDGATANAVDDELVVKTIASLAAH